MNVQMDAPLTSSTESHLQCATAELTVSRHVVVSKWSNSGCLILSGLHLCVRRSPQMLRFPNFCNCRVYIHCADFHDVLSRAVLSYQSRVRRMLLPHQRSCCKAERDMALFAALRTLSHSAFETPELRVTTRCSTDSNARLS